MDAIFFSAKKQIELIHKKQISSYELTKEYLDRIEKYDHELNSFLYINSTKALESAKKCDEAISKNNISGKLFGLPIAIKDLTHIKGMPTTFGSLLTKNNVADLDDLVFKRIKKHGPVILGKTNTPEFGLMGHTENFLKDHCRTPWNINKSAGGSSGGAGSAVAAGFCSIAMGGDAGGSIRIPSSYNGIFGIKPTQGRVPRQNSPTHNMISQNGPMTRYVEDSALMLEIITGFDSEDPSSLNRPPIKFEDNFWDYSIEEYYKETHSKEKLNIAWVNNFGDVNPSNEIKEKCLNSLSILEKTGHTITEIKIDLGEIFDAWFNIFSVSTYIGHEENYKNNKDKFAWYTQEAFENAKNISSTDYAKSILTLKKVQLAFAKLFQTYDLISSPTMPTTAFEIGNPPQVINGEKVHPSWGFCFYSFPINLSGAPAVNIPSGFDKQGLPIGLQLIAPWEQEKELIKISHHLESVLDWPSQIPNKYQI
jgi:Asp-tRNA(Asn)/Glu-tRNA(Gln) amidotransferase A subunit family amidase